MQCAKCNSANDPDALFCSECGSAIIQKPKESPVKGGRNYLYALFLIPVLVVAAGIGYYKFFLPRGIAAVVNGEEITMTDLEAGVARMKAAYSGMNFEGPRAEQQMRRLRYHVLNGLITEQLILQEARKADIRVSDQETAAAIERSRQSSGMDKEAFSKAVVRQYGSASSFEEAVKREATIKKLFDAKIAPQGVDAAASGAFFDSWIQNLYSKAVVRITLAEQVSGAGCGCCGGPQKRAGSGGLPSQSDPAAPSSNQKAVDAALRYWHEKHGPDAVTTKAADYGCHVQVEILKDNQVIGSLRYQGGRIFE